MELFIDAEIPDEAKLEKSVNWLKNRGFCIFDGETIRFLPHIERFLRSVEQWALSAEEDMEKEENL